MADYEPTHCLTSNEVKTILSPEISTQGPQARSTMIIVADELGSTSLGLDDIPPELRHMIWESKELGANIVTIVRRVKSPQSPGDGYEIGAISATNLRVCRESRALHIKNHPECFSGILTNAAHFSGMTDVLVFADMATLEQFVTSVGSFKQSRASKAEYVAIKIDPLSAECKHSIIAHERFGDKIGRAIHKFGGLKKMFLIVETQCGAIHLDPVYVASLSQLQLASDEEAHAQAVAECLIKPLERITELLSRHMGIWDAIARRGETVKNKFSNPEIIICTMAELQQRFPMQRVSRYLG